MKEAHKDSFLKISRKRYLENYLPVYNKDDILQKEIIKLLLYLQDKVELCSAKDEASFSMMGSLPKSQLFFSQFYEIVESDTLLSYLFALSSVLFDPIERSVLRHYLIIYAKSPEITLLKDPKAHSLVDATRIKLLFSIWLYDYTKSLVKVENPSIKIIYELLLAGSIREASVMASHLHLPKLSSLISKYKRVDHHLMLNGTTSEAEYFDINEQSEFWNEMKKIENSSNDDWKYLVKIFNLLSGEVLDYEFKSNDMSYYWFRLGYLLWWKKDSSIYPLSRMVNEWYDQTNLAKMTFEAQLMANLLKIFSDHFFTLENAFSISKDESTLDLYQNELLWIKGLLLHHLNIRAVDTMKYHLLLSNTLVLQLLKATSNMTESASILKVTMMIALLSPFSENRETLFNTILENYYERNEESCFITDEDLKKTLLNGKPLALLSNIEIELIEKYHIHKELILRNKFSYCYYLKRYWIGFLYQLYYLSITTTPYTSSSSLYPFIFPILLNAFNESQAFPVRLYFSFAIQLVQKKMLDHPLLLIIEFISKVQMDLTSLSSEFVILNSTEDVFYDAASSTISPRFHDQYYETNTLFIAQIKENKKFQARVRNIRSMVNSLHTSIHQLKSILYDLIQNTEWIEIDKLEFIKQKAHVFNLVNHLSAVVKNAYNILFYF